MITYSLILIGFIKAQRDFIDDIYSGNLLADVAHDHRETLDRTRGRVFDLEDLLKEMAEEERIAIEAAKNPGSDSENKFENLTDSDREDMTEEDAERLQNEIDENRLNDLLKEDDENNEKNSL